MGKQTYKPDKSTVRGGGQEDWRDLLMKSGSEIALVTYNREGANRRELSVLKGDYLEILNTDRKWWKVRNRSQEVTIQLTIYYSFNILPLDRLCSLHYSEDTDLQRSRRLLERFPKRKDYPPKVTIPLQRKTNRKEISFSIA